MDRKWICGFFLILSAPLAMAQITFRADTVNITNDDLVSEKCVQVGLYVRNTDKTPSSWAQITASLTYNDTAGIISGTPFATVTNFSQNPDGGIFSPGQSNTNAANVSTSCAPINIINVATTKAGPEANFANGTNAASILTEDINVATRQIRLNILNFAGNNFTLEPGQDYLFAVIEFTVSEILDGPTVDGLQSLLGATGINVDFVGNNVVPDGNIVSDGLNVVQAATSNGGVQLGNGPTGDRVGVFRPSLNAFFVDVDGNNRINFPGDRVNFMGAPNDIPLVGNWSGDDTDNLGLRRLTMFSRFFLDVSGDNVIGAGDRQLFMGATTDVAIVGDWNGDGTDELGLFRPSTNQFFLDLDNSGSITGSDAVFGMGASGDLPLVGDWNGDGTDDVGLFRPSTNAFFLDVSGNRSIGAGDAIFGMGANGDLPLVGDWDGDGSDNVGLFRPSNNLFFLDTNNSRSIGAGDAVFGMGTNGDIPIVGKW